MDLKGEEYSWSPKNKGSHMHGMYKERLACDGVYLFHAQLWDLHMNVSVSDDLGVFDRMHVSQPQIPI